jgi:hypothetical protein
MLQRRRWALGAMQVLKAERLLTSKELTVPQRLAYGATLFAWFDALRSMLFVVLPIVVLLTGVMPISVDLALFGPAFLITFLAQFTALRLLARGYYPPFLSVVFETLRMPAVVPALAELLRPSRTRFSVTPKGRQADDRHRVRVPILLKALISLAVVALCWFGLVISGSGPMSYAFPGAMIGTAGFLAVNVILLAVAVRRIVAQRFAGERRASVRFDVDMGAILDGRVARIIDVSLTGARVRLGDFEGVEESLRGLVMLRVLYGEIDLFGHVVNVYRREGGTVEVGLVFEPDQWQAVRSLALVVFHGNPGRDRLEAVAA